MFSPRSVVQERLRVLRSTWWMRVHRTRTPRSVLFYARWEKEQDSRGEPSEGFSSRCFLQPHCPVYDMPDASILSIFQGTLRVHKLTVDSTQRSEKSTRWLRRPKMSTPFIFKTASSRVKRKPSMPGVEVWRSNCTYPHPHKEASMALKSDPWGLF